MGVRMMDLITGSLDALRYEPTAKRVRVCLGGEPVADTREARLVWEPRRVVPTYAVPIAGLSAQLVPAGANRRRRDRAATVTQAASGCRGISSRPVLDPTIPSAPTPAGHRVRRHRGRRDGRGRGVPARRPRPGRLRHPRVRRVRMARGGRAHRQPPARPVRPHRRVAQQPPCAGRARRAAARRIHATHAVVRDAAAGAVLPAARGRRRPTPAQRHGDLLRIQGPCHYYSVPDGPRDVAWTYHEPLHDAEIVRDRVCFFDEHLDVTVDGERRDRPVTPWSD